MPYWIGYGSDDLLGGAWYGHTLTDSQCVFRANVVGFHEFGDANPMVPADCPQ